MPQTAEESDSSSQSNTDDVPKEEKKTLDSRFTESQLDYLRDNKEAYRYSSATQRKELAQETYEKFMQEMQAAGRDCSKDDASAVNENVRLWYQQRARSRKDEPRWGIAWDPRQVFYKENMAMVLETQRKLYAEAVGVQPSEVSIEPAEVEAAGEEDEAESEINSAKSAKPPRPFNFFQRALTAEWTKLNEKEQKKYKKMATLWREQGPNEEEKRRLAETRLVEIMTQISRDLYAQAGVRLVSLASYTNTQGALCVTFDVAGHIATLDFNHKIDGGQTFKSGARQWWHKSNPEAAYGDFLVASGKDGQDHRKQPRSDLVLKKNEYGEPILPDPRIIPLGMKKHKYFVALIRAFVRGTYATSKGVKEKSREAAPPWSALARDLGSLVSRDYFPSKYEPLCDPNVIRVDRAEKILKFWFRRQENGEIPLSFHHYLGTDDEYHERVPREVQVLSDSEASEDEGQPKAPTRKTRARRDPGGSRATGLPDHSGSAPSSDASSESEVESRSRTKKKKKASVRGPQKSAARLSAKIGAKSRGKLAGVQKGGRRIGDDSDGEREDSGVGAVPSDKEVISEANLGLQRDIKGKSREVTVDMDVDIHINQEPAVGSYGIETPDIGTPMIVNSEIGSPTVINSRHGTPTLDLINATSDLRLVSPDKPVLATQSHGLGIEPALMEAYVREQVAKYLQMSGMNPSKVGEGTIPTSTGGIPEMSKVPHPGPMPGLTSPLPGLPPSLRTLPATVPQQSMVGNPAPVTDIQSKEEKLKPKPKPTKKKHRKLGEADDSDHPNDEVIAGIPNPVEEAAGSSSTAMGEQEMEQPLSDGEKPKVVKKQKGRKANAEDRALLAQAEKHGKVGKRMAKPSKKAMGGK
ncbi:hypothetical protein D9611_004736 [Ephemerocybe angulata]|uniref:Homeobox domain-containing protein n=1 Tax=Ephemerocybe angulata TaxID=980116 RepID=A0A8H5EX59_9AGAR|nr:hypothetical protein D9611_004736 [Tulosesus angulatus]